MTEYFADLAGALTPTGTVTTSANKALAGALTFAGAVKASVSKALAGALTFAGTVTTSVSKVLAGALSFVGTVSRTLTLNRSLAGAMTFSGSLGTTAKTIDPLLLPFRITGVYLRKFTTDLAGGDPNTILAKSRYYLQPTLITGLGIPVSSLRLGNVYRMDGSYFSGLNITSRTVTITIPVVGDIQAKRAEIYNMFSQDPALSSDTYYNLYLELDTGFSLVLHKVILDTMTDNIANPRWQLLNISFFSADPWWYSTRLKSSTISTTYAGPPNTKLDTFFAVECLGTGIAYPKITVTGQSYLFEIRNLDTGQVIGPVYLSCAAGEVITIVTSPTEDRGITSSLHSPSNIINHVFSGNLDFYLDPGFPVNNLVVYGETTGGTVTTKVEWSESYIGV